MTLAPACISAPRIPTSITVNAIRSSLPATEWNSERICSLPLFPDMHDDDVTRVIAALRHLAGA